ncbi:MAG: glutaminase [Paramuribaculum sp.]|nr:glutaminase [Paramuribaculum sp.]
MTADYKSIINHIYEEVGHMPLKGAVADYIPALAEVDPSQYGIAIATTSGESYGVGDCFTKFSIQSISKVFTLAMVVRHLGHTLWESVGREPSGSPFNSLVQLEYEHGIPRNPLINAGALVVTDRLMNLYRQPKEEILNFIRDMSGCDDIYFDHRVARSELSHGARNIALASFMKSFGNIDNEVDGLIDVYCHQCSVAMSCMELAKSFLFLANRGVNPVSGERILSISRSKRLGAIMLTCGFYDESGDFAFRVGLPGKSGVGGGIVAIIPGEAAIAVWSPALNSYGNSIRGIETLERFTTLLGISIF